MKGIAASLLATALIAGPALAVQSPAKTPAKAPATKPATATKTTAKTEPQKVASVKKHSRRHRHNSQKSFKPEAKVTTPLAK